MNLLKGGKTNWKYILIVVILAIIVGGGIFGYTKSVVEEMYSLTKFLEIKKPEKITEEKCEDIQDLTEQAKCYISLAKETKDESYCGKIEIPEAPEVRANCYAELAFLKNDPAICERVETASLKSSCLNYFKEKVVGEELEETTEVKVYFHNREMYLNLQEEICPGQYCPEKMYERYRTDDCDFLFPVQRIVPKPKTGVELAKLLFEELLKGPTEKEKNEGSSEGLVIKMMKDFEIRNGTFAIKLDEEKIKEWERENKPRLFPESLSSCELRAYFGTIERTLGQVPGVKIEFIPPF